MKKKVLYRQFVGFLFTSVAGALLHFVFEIGGRSPVLGAIASVNESTWEHMKLLFFPSFLYALLESRAFGRAYPFFWRTKLAGISLGTLLIPVLFYTANGAFGKTPDLFNILFFFVAAAGEYILETHIFTSTGKCAPGQSPQKGKRPVISERAAFAALCLSAAAFAAFTFRTPRLPLFLDPVTGTYGI